MTMACNYLLVIPFVTFICLHAPVFVHGDTSDIYLSNNTGYWHGGYWCRGDVTDTCHIYCDKASNDGQYLACGKVGKCYIHCTEKKCLSSGKLYASSAKELYVDVSAQECMQDATVYTPTTGNATLTMSAIKGFKGMSIESGTNAQNIIVNCSADTNGKDACKDMSINAAEANYLEITVSNALEFENSEVQCPINSSYEPKQASCVLNVSNYGIVKDVLIHASSGTPRDFLVVDDVTADIMQDNPLILQCDAGTDYFPFGKWSSCWNEATSKPTMNPTNSPTATTTVNPTNTPSNKPTYHPVTVEPSLYPTSYPSGTPTTRRPTLYAIIIEVTPSPIDEQMVTMRETLDNKVTKEKHEQAGDKSLGNHKIGIKTLLIIGVLFVIYGICLFLCYWYRKETLYKQIFYAQEFKRIRHLKKPLMPTDTDDGAFAEQQYKSVYVAMQIFDGNQYNENLLAVKPQQNTRECSVNSEDSDGETMSDEDLEIVDDINKEHCDTKGNEMDALIPVENEIEGFSFKSKDDVENTTLTPGFLDTSEEHDL